MPYPVEVLELQVPTREPIHPLRDPKSLHQEVEEVHAPVVSPKAGQEVAVPVPVSGAGIRCRVPEVAEEAVVRRLDVPLPDESNPVWWLGPSFEGPQDYEGGGGDGWRKSPV